ncbi:glycosyltransferase family 2 protein [Wenzhouxiangella marina]|uniref:Putative glycosyltransferase n=1 Tax=Wenzhouxiangella marina TaxID=1579979 RepID=A0A0K0XZF4_9GAMM|nr:glycosyltransferase family 2 protein [Wenzhouxiangella marina]AKS43001.1 Putative glycosyltransferase [Wenzhouxiangella marina]
MSGKRVSSPTGTSQPEPLVSVVIPAFNESSGLERLSSRVIEAVESCACQAELVVVDDGSTDDTWARLRQLSAADARIRGVSLARNFGKEAAVLAGLDEACGEAVIVMDGDGQHPPEQLPAMIEAWRAGVDIVEGVKKSRADQSWPARLASRLFNRIFTRLTGVDLTEAADFRLLSRCAVDQLLELPERAFFFRGLSSWMGYPTARIEFETAPRDSGQSKFGLFDLARYALRNTIAFTSAPLQLVTLAGLIFALFAVLLGLQTLWQWYSGQAVEGFTTVILLLLIHGSVVMIALGVIGQYIAQIHHEVKKRPHFIVKDRLRSGRDS